MKKSLVLAAVLLAGTAAGAAFASTRDGGALVRSAIGSVTAHGDASAEAPFRVADDHRRDRDHHDRKDHRRHHDDDEDDDEGGAGTPGGRMPVTGPADPTTPVPDNGLFQGKARPKVEVN